MNRKKFLTIMLTLAIAASTTALMTGCAASVRHLNGTTGETSSQDTAADESAADSTADTGDEESSEADEESSEADEESSEAVEESSEADEESSEAAEESSEAAEESSEAAESSAEEDDGDATIIKFTNPNDWDNVNAYVYLSNEDNNQWPGEPMTKEDDGTYSFKVDKHYMEGVDARVIFNDGKHQIPKATGFIIKNGQTYDENYSD